jgi:SAM-dependent methyltransferase
MMLVMSQPSGSAPKTNGPGTQDKAYTERLIRLQTVWWKRILPVQAPYRYNVRRLNLGKTIDIGCGIGRLLVALPEGSVGIDHNADFVQVVRSLGRPAYTVDEFPRSPEAKVESFDSMLLAHVIEHVDNEIADRILQTHLPYVRAGGRVHFITPQERGHASDPTHLDFVDFAALLDLAKRNGLTVERSYSFPFPRWMGKVFKYNEFHVTARKRGT